MLSVKQLLASQTGTACTVVACDLAEHLLYNINNYKDYDDPKLLQDIDGLVKIACQKWIDMGKGFFHPCQVLDSKFRIMVDSEVQTSCSGEVKDEQGHTILESTESVLKKWISDQYSEASIAIVTKSVYTFLLFKIGAFFCAIDTHPNVVEQRRSALEAVGYLTKLEEGRSGVLIQFLLPGSVATFLRHYTEKEQQVQFVFVIKKV